MASEKRKIALANQLALDMARMGTCGASDRGGAHAKAALMVADQLQGHAAEGPVRDLYYLMRFESPKDCAAGLGEVWRTQNPFRPVRRGDPYEVLIPQLEDARAARALDQSAQLPAPPVGLMNRGDQLERWLAMEPGSMKPEDYEKLPYRRSRALALLGVARSELKRVWDEFPTELHEKRDLAWEALEVATDWAQSPELRWDERLRWKGNLAPVVEDLYETKHVVVRGQPIRPVPDSVKAVSKIVANAFDYVKGYNYITHLMDNYPEEYRSLFPDFYSAEAVNTLGVAPSTVAATVAVGISVGAALLVAF